MAGNSAFRILHSASRFWPWLAAASSGALLALAFAPWDLTPLVWVALVAVVLFGGVAETVNGLVLVVITVDVVLLAVLLAVTAYGGRPRRAAGGTPSEARASAPTSPLA